MLFNHFLRALSKLLHEPGMPHLLLRQAPRMGFLPYQHACLVTQIQKQRIIGIMACTHTVGPHLPHQLQILHHPRRRGCQAKSAVLFVPIEALQLQLLPVQQNPVPLRPNLPEPDPVNQVVHRLPVQHQHRFYFIQFRCFRAPNSYIPAGNGKVHLLRPVCRQLRLRLRHPARNTYPHGAFQRLPAQMMDPCTDLCGPSCRCSDRRHMAPGDVGIPQLLQDHRPIDSAVCVIVVGNMQRGIIAKSVIRFNSQRMLSLRHIQRQPLESGIGAIMLR